MLQKQTPHLMIGEIIIRDHSILKYLGTALKLLSSRTIALQQITESRESSPGHNPIQNYYSPVYWYILRINISMASPQGMPDLLG
jgi:hypothetical protein